MPEGIVGLQQGHASGNVVAVLVGVAHRSLIEANDILRTSMCLCSLWGHFCFAYSFGKNPQETKNPAEDHLSQTGPERRDNRRDIAGRHFGRPRVAT